eukprot:CAMPEP_0184983224 /NCGR_PEP_ID=MMETSP1098-20130426/12522_1 /TAXON_ID=89044 /ORGANISM="Spumella elongata, Strain CCAP 955/1" /LENGTH=528 /DNA_ID=CAMNT_0027507031 /DNA_START=99 /DNA_END=1685 /DNA_ORIENTATION=+
MALSLSDVMKMRQREQLSKTGSMKAQAQEFAAILKAKEIQRQKEAHQLVLAKKAEKDLEVLRERERKREEDERKTKRYFSLDKYERKIPAPDEPVYFGDMKEKNHSWQAHGSGQFSLNGEVIMKGTFKEGDFVQGEVRWSDGTAWNGVLVNHKMNGIGVIIDADGNKQEALMRSNLLVCYKDELRGGIQIQFEEPMFNIYPTNSRKPTATILRHVRDWIYLCKFHTDVWPQDRQVDLSVTSNFNLLRLRPMVYNLQTFGIASEPDRIYDYRFEQKINRSRLRDTANNVLFQQAQTAEMLASVNGSGGDEVENEGGDEVSTLGGFEDDATNDGTVASTAKKLRSKLGTMKISASQMDMTLEAAKAVAAYHQSNMAPPGTAASDSTQLSTVRKLDDKGREIVADSRLYGPSRQRLVSKFPVRDKRDRSTNYFESRMVGIGAAKEEDEMKLQDALKKQQWAKLIEERRAQQEEAKKKEVEQQQRLFMEESLNEKRLADQSAKNEAARYKLETEEAVANELSRIGTPASARY